MPPSRPVTARTSYAAAVSGSSSVAPVSSPEVSYRDKFVIASAMYAASVSESSEPGSFQGTWSSILAANNLPDVVIPSSLGLHAHVLAASGSSRSLSEAPVVVPPAVLKVFSDAKMDISPVVPKRKLFLPDSGSSKARKSSPGPSGVGGGGLHGEVGVAERPLSARLVIGSGVERLACTSSGVSAGVDSVVEPSLTASWAVEAAIPEVFVGEVVSDPFLLPASDVAVAVSPPVEVGSVSSVVSASGVAPAGSLSGQDDPDAKVLPAERAAAIAATWSNRMVSASSVGLRLLISKTFVLPKRPTHDFLYKAWWSSKFVFHSHTSAHITAAGLVGIIKAGGVDLTTAPIDWVPESRLELLRASAMSFGIGSGSAS